MERKVAGELCIDSGTIINYGVQYENIFSTLYYRIFFNDVRLIPDEPAPIFLFNNANIF